jgi:hypothetical protein
MPAPHLTAEGIAADAWLLGQRERARVLYDELVRLAPNARAYSLILHELEAHASHPSGPLEARPKPPRLPSSALQRSALQRSALQRSALQRSVTPRVVDLALVVRSRGATHVPVRLDGERVGDTGEAGVLHVHVRAPEGRTLALELDTRDAPALAPPSPRRTIRVERASPTQSFEVTFETPRRPPAKPRNRLPQRAAPYRMN